MVINTPIFGARAEVILRFDGELETLATKLSEGLIHVPFEVGPRDEPPHDLVGSCEALGFEIWLEQTSFGNYRLRFETEHCLEESFNDQMYDLSLWLARYVSSICDVDTVAKAVDGEDCLFPSK